MATYTLTDGTRKTQLTISGDTTVVFPTKLDYFGVRSLDGANILVSKIKAPTVLEDGVYSTDEGDGDVVVDDGVFTDTLYLKGSGTVVVYGGAKSNHLPFKVGGKGGGGSGSITIYYTTTALTDNATTNPITVNGESVTVNANEFAIYGKKEFVFDGAHWHEFGDLTDTVGRVEYVDTNTEGLGYPANGEVFNSESTNSATARGAHAEGIAARARGEGSHAESYSVAGARGSHAHGGGVVASTAVFATAMGSHTYAQALSSTVVGTWNRVYNTSQGETIPNLLFVVGNGSNPGATSNILEVDYTSMNVNGDIKCHNLVVPVGGYEETALWTGDQSSAPSEIEISEAYTNFDALFFKTRTTTTTSEDYISAYILASAYGIGEFFQIFGYADSGYRYVWYKFTDATHLERGTIGDLYMRKIVGIKYPKLYVPPVSLNQSPATLLTNQTEELTDGNR